MDSQIILFDFEYTAWKGSKARKWSEPWEHREIIQIAAARIAAGDSAAELECFDCLVKPRHNGLLSPYIIDLTGIQQAAVDAQGIPFPEALAAFYAFCGQGCLPLFCYGDDLTVLRENLALNALDPSAYPAELYDIRVMFEQAGIDTRPYTSGTVHQAIGAEFHHAAHNALNDVRSLEATIRHLLHLGRINPGWAETCQPMGYIHQP